MSYGLEIRDPIHGFIYREPKEKKIGLNRYRGSCDAVVVSAHPIMLVGVSVKYPSLSEGFFAISWSGCSEQHIPSREGAFHDIASTTLYRGHANSQFVGAHAKMLRPASVVIRAALQEISITIGT
jgi:hypothetical protein